MARILPKLKVVDGCWDFVGARTTAGYGTIWNGEKTIYTHRAMFEVMKGALKTGLVLDHLCRRPSCMNPHHLEQVTNRDNLIRGNVGKNPLSWANRKRKTHCKKGHEYSPNNTYIRPENNSQGCIACRRANTKIQNDKRKYKVK